MNLFFTNNSGVALEFDFTTSFEKHHSAEKKFFRLFHGFRNQDYSQHAIRLIFKSFVKLILRETSYASRWNAVSFTAVHCKQISTISTGKRKQNDTKLLCIEEEWRLYSALNSNQNYYNSRTILNAVRYHLYSLTEAGSKLKWPWTYYTQSYHSFDKAK